MITNEILIAAPPEQVWALNVDVERWPAITPTTMTSVERLDEGELRVGSSARVRQPMQRPTVWTVTELEPGSRFRWATKVGWLTMAATHEAHPVEGGTRNVLTVDLAGVGSKVLGRLVGSKIREAITTENAAFKATAEAAVGQPAA